MPCSATSCPATGLPRSATSQTSGPSFRQLAPLRPICGHVREELFANAQDKAVIQKAVNACRDESLQQFIAVTLHLVFSPLERFRRWGMVCDCCAPIREERPGQSVHCPNNRKSRRLKTAWAKTQEVAAELRANARTVTLAECEGSQNLLRVVKGMLRKASDLLVRRNKYLGIVPWLLVQADSEEGARACVQQIDAVPLAYHDLCTRYHRTTPLRPQARW